MNTNPMYTPRELGHQLRDSGARVLVILDLLLPRYQEVKAETPVEVLVRTGIQDYLPFPKNLLYPLMLKRKGQAPRSLEGTPWRAFLKPGNPQPVPLDLDDLALLQYTGGTTGVAKGAMLTHRNLSSNALQVRSWIPDFQEGEEVVLGAIPFFHVYGMTVAMYALWRSSMPRVSMISFNQLWVLWMVVSKTSRPVALIPTPPFLHLPSYLLSMPL